MYLSIGEEEWTGNQNDHQGKTDDPSQGIVEREEGGTIKPYP
jgi:hypothetical protein